MGSPMVELALAEPKATRRTRAHRAQDMQHTSIDGLAAHGHGQDLGLQARAVAGRARLVAEVLLERAP
jgi:flagellar biosynthesis/type III secretory pathway ATPase